MFARLVSQREMLQDLRTEDRFYNRLEALPVSMFHDYIFNIDLDSHPAGVELAAYELLRASGIWIRHVDLTTHLVPEEPGDDDWIGRDAHYRPDGAVAFNDHGGGSESHFRILFNTSDDGQRVLFCPPMPDGSPSNMTFRRSNFNVLAPEPYGDGGYEYWDRVPNLLKSTGPAGKNRETNDPTYFLVTAGGVDPRPELQSVLEQAGFTFTTENYGEALERGTEYERLRRIPAFEHEQQEYRAWPFINPHATRYKGADPIYLFQPQLDIIQALIEAKQQLPVA